MLICSTLNRNAYKSILLCCDDNDNDTYNNQIYIRDAIFSLMCCIPIYIYINSLNILLCIKEPKIM